MSKVAETSADAGLTELFRNPEEKEAENKSKLLANMRKFEKAGRGRFKLELFLGMGRSGFKPYPGMLSFWESGTQLHGGGDAKIYICPGKHLGLNDCQAYIPHEHNQYGFGMCEKCGRAWQGEQLIGEVLGKHNTQQWADLLWIYFMRFDSNCDIYLKYSEGNLQLADETTRAKRGADGEAYAKAKKSKLVIYPLKNIMKDSAHTDILKCFQVFLNT